MGDDQIGISFPMDRDMHLRLKLATTASGVSIKDYIIRVLDDALPKIVRDDDGGLLISLPHELFEEMTSAEMTEQANT